MGCFVTPLQLLYDAILLSVAAAVVAVVVDESDVGAYRGHSGFVKNSSSVGLV